MNRLLNFIFAVIVSIIVLPFILITAVFVFFKLGSPILFSQVRPGYKEKSFKMYKFRSMTDERDMNGELLPDAQRLTKFGVFLRSTSLDELPALWNVLKGDMNLVGPRPLLEKYLSFYSPEQRKRHNVRPGMTGWAQVNGRNSISWQERFELDIWYVSHQAFWLDIIIIIMTIGKIFKREGINEKGKATMSEFVG